MATRKPKLKLASDSTEPATPIAKPEEPFDINKFKSTQTPTLAGVQTLQTGLPCHKISEARDFVRLHPDETKFWSANLCFVNVPIIGGQKSATLHLIVEDLAMKYLQSARILRFRLALATKPGNAFFLCHVPTQHLDNPWNATNVDACEQAKSLWTMATSRITECVDGYKITFAVDKDAFDEPEWPSQSLPDMVGRTFVGRIITTENDPALLRLIGAKQRL